jgi:TonB family protein
MLLRLLHLSRVVGFAVILLFLTTAVRAQDQEHHLKCPVTREQLIQLEWPLVINSVSPDYPETAASKRISGPVRVDVDVNAKGIVTAARVITGDKVLADAAQKAALRWTFGSTDNGMHALQLNFMFRAVTYVPPTEKPECEGSPYTIDVLWRATTP